MSGWRTVFSTTVDVSESMQLGSSDVHSPSISQMLVVGRKDAGCEQKNSAGNFKAVAGIQWLDLCQRLIIQSSSVATSQVWHIPVAILRKHFTVPTAASIAVQHDLVTPPRPIIVDTSGLRTWMSHHEPDEDTTRYADAVISPLSNAFASTTICQRRVLIPTGRFRVATPVDRSIGGDSISIQQTAARNATGVRGDSRRTS